MIGLTVVKTKDKYVITTTDCVHKYIEKDRYEEGLLAHQQLLQHFARQQTLIQPHPSIHRQWQMQQQAYNPQQNELRRNLFGLGGSL